MTPVAYFQLNSLIDQNFSILNKSSYEGLVFNKADLEFDGGKMRVLCDSGYQQLKPHALTEVSFTTYSIKSA